MLGLGTHIIAGVRAVVYHQQVVTVLCSHAALFSALGATPTAFVCVLQFKHPRHVQVEFQQLQEHTNNSFMLEARKSLLVLKGQMLPTSIQLPGQQVPCQCHFWLLKLSCWCGPASAAATSRPASWCCFAAARQHTPFNIASLVVLLLCMAV